MFESMEVQADDAAACAEGLVGSVVERRMADAARFAWVARWADLHEPDRLVRREGPGVESRRQTPWQIETDGIPDVTMAGVVELGMLLQTSTRSAERLLRDVLEIRHRLPRHWDGVLTGAVEDWKARELAKATRRLTPEQAAWVDAAVGDALVTLPWGRALDVIAGKVIAADPAGHEARLQEEDARQFVSTRRRSNTYGLRTLVARGAAGDVARLEAMVSHLAAVMRAAGDQDVVDTLRAKALALLANPALACVFLAGEQQSPTAKTDEALPAVPEVAQPAGPSAVELAREFGIVLRDAGVINKLRPRSVLYLHLSDAAVSGVHGSQVARVEDPVAAGAIGMGQLREWLGNDRVVVKPVIDPLGAVPTDDYEIPTRLHEAQCLLTPYEIVPYGTQPARQADGDHTVPYVPPDEGGPPGQTAIGNLGPLGRGHHLAKTFCGFAVHQPSPGVYFWRTPTGWWYQVDHRGTQPLGRRRPAVLDSSAVQLDSRTLSDMERAFRSRIVSHLVA